MFDNESVDDRRQYQTGFTLRSLPAGNRTLTISFNNPAGLSSRMVGSLALLTWKR